MSTPTSGGKAREFYISFDKDADCPVVYAASETAFIKRNEVTRVIERSAYIALENELAKLKAQTNHVCPECGHDMVSMDASKLMDKLAECEKREREQIADCMKLSDKLAAAETSIKQGKQLSDADNKRIYELEARIRELEAELLHSRRETK